jgi:hypothetical protein
MEASKPIFDLVNFDLLLRVFPSFKIVSFCLNLHWLKLWEKEKRNKPFFQTGIQDFQDLLDHLTIFHWEWFLKINNHQSFSIVISEKDVTYGSAIFQVKDKCTSLVGSRNKLDHSEKKYGLPLWLCTTENKDLIILALASFPWHSMKLHQHSDSLQLLNN